MSIDVHVETAQGLLHDYLLNHDNPAVRAIAEFGPPEADAPQVQELAARLRSRPVGGASRR